MQRRVFADILDFKHEMMVSRSLPNVSKVNVAVPIAGAMNGILELLASRVLFIRLSTLSKGQPPNILAAA
jgi:hypothetical protein